MNYPVIFEAVGTLGDDICAEAAEVIEAGGKRSAKEKAPCVGANAEPQVYYPVENDRGKTFLAALGGFCAAALLAVFALPFVIKLYHGMAENPSAASGSGIASAAPAAPQTSAPFDMEAVRAVKRFSDFVMDSLPEHMFNFDIVNKSDSITNGADRYYKATDEWLGQLRGMVTDTMYDDFLEKLSKAGIACIRGDGVYLRPTMADWTFAVRFMSCRLELDGYEESGDTVNLRFISPGDKDDRVNGEDIVIRASVIKGENGFLIDSCGILDHMYLSDYKGFYYNDEYYPF